jgi:hypothetical protein
MSTIVPAPNNNHAPNVTVDNNPVAVATITSAMSRNAASLLST